MYRFKDKISCPNCENAILKDDGKIKIFCPHCNWAITTDVWMTDDDIQVKAIIEKATLLFQSKSYEEALKLFDTAILFSPGEETFWNNKGLTLWFLERSEEAIICFDKSISINDKDSVPYFYKGRTLLILGKTLEAIACLDKAIQFNPRNAEAWLTKGLAIHGTNKKEGIRCFRKAKLLGLDKKYDLVFTTMGVEISKPWWKIW